VVSCFILGCLLQSGLSGHPRVSFPPFSLGSDFFRDYTEYYPLPMNTSMASAAKWVQNATSCDPNLGIRWNQEKNGVLESNPISLFFTPTGQLAGIGVTIYGDVFQNLVNLGYLQPLGVLQGYQAYFLSITFRNSSTICSGNMSPDEIGDTLIVNANSIAVQLPPTEDQAINALWSPGSCFSTMGYHYFYDLATAPNMSWVGANLLPVVMMYNEGNFNAFFFASGIEQISFLDTNQWDPAPLPNILMCKNWCNPKCTFNDTSLWSTMHIYTNNYKEVKCPGDCSISCCNS